jgi:hypothetical protein
MNYDIDDKWEKLRFQFYRTKDLVVVYEQFQTIDTSTGATDTLEEESWNEFPNGGRTEY